MNVLVLAAQAWDGTAVPCKFTVEVDQVAFEVTSFPISAVSLPDGANLVRIVATPSVAWFWEDEFNLIVTGDQVDPVVNELPKLTTTTAAAVGVVITRVTMTVTRLRDVSPTAKDWLTQPPDKRLGKPATLRNVMDHGDFPPDDWSLPDRPDTTFVDAGNPIDGKLVSTVILDAVGADVECAVFEVAGVAVPKLLAVSWPTGLLRDENSAPTPFLVYYHPGTGQNVPKGYYLGGELGPYPWNFDFLYFVLYAYQWYAVDPLTQSPYSKGIPFQIAAAGKQVVSVLPCNAPVANEFGAFTDAASVEAILLDLQALMFRRAGVGDGPKTLGRTAVGAFSSGNNFMAMFLQSPKNRAHNFCQNTLKEVYCFDPPGYITGGLTAAALTWAGGAETGRRVALYTQSPHEAHTKVLGHTPPASPFVESPDPTRTAAVLPAATWKATVEAFTATPRPNWGFQETHQIISAMMLTHAMATSGF
jgi:hypothetical protein